MSQTLNQNKVLKFYGSISKSNNEIVINYSRHYTDFQRGQWQLIVKDVIYESKKKNQREQ